MQLGGWVAIVNCMKVDLKGYEKYLAWERMFLIWLSQIIFTDNFSCSSPVLWWFICDRYIGKERFDVVNLASHSWPVGKAVICHLSDLKVPFVQWNQFYVDFRSVKFPYFNLSDFVFYQSSLWNGATCGLHLTKVRVTIQWCTIHASRKKDVQSEVRFVVICTM